MGFLRQRPSQHNTTFGWYGGAPGHALHSGRYQILGEQGTETSSGTASIAFFI
jgi:hypothetical protein